MPAIWIPKRLVEIGLINTAAENATSFVCHCEIEYESRVIAAAAESRGTDSKIIMLTGPSASGKTTTANKLAEALIRSGTHAVVVSLDEFYKDIDDYPRLPDGSKDYENVYALDVDEIHRCLLQLLREGAADFPLFDFQTEKRKPERHRIALEGGVVVVEGIHALNPLLTDVLPEGSVYKIYAGLREEYSHGGQRTLPTRDIRLARRMVRDNKFRGHSLEKTLNMWPMVCDGEDTYIKAYKPYADLLLDTSFSYEICVLAPFVTELKGKLDDPVLGPQLDDLADRFARCNPLSDKLIPPQSMLREFIGPTAHDPA
ncbi:nucleoside kinase [Ruminococcaceae bacterium OttesenSCG-928-D13]|nr:nucleoside kinase [Ruminococcaceae bacterium OttesenSCG-928-D13]